MYTFIYLCCKAIEDKEVAKAISMVFRGLASGGAAIPPWTKQTTWR